MPHPRKNEKKEEYIARCMQSKEMKKEFPDQKQHAAVCYSYWDRKDEAANTKLSFKQFLMNENTKT